MAPSLKNESDARIGSHAARQRGARQSREKHVRIEVDITGPANGSIRRIDGDAIEFGWITPFVKNTPADEVTEVDLAFGSAAEANP